MTMSASLGLTYLALLGREPDGPGFAFWLGVLERGEATLAEVVADFMLTREFAGRAAFSDEPDTFLEEAYQLILGRAPDDAGRAFYRGLLEDGVSQETVLAALADSPEFAASVPPAVTVVPDLETIQFPSFNYGVASGDPAADSVVLWTHAEAPDAPGDVALTWEVATDAAFTDVVASGTVTAEAANDNTAKAIAGGLEAGTEYFYRFVTDSGETSDVGRTKTLPEGQVAEVSLGVFSCANFPAGFFNPYAEAATREFDALVHLGDYIYEYGQGGYATEQSEALNRAPIPRVELQSADDYSARYKQYHTDDDLQALRASAPLIAIWDDHETANDSWVTGAENHDPATEGDWATRRDIAIEAYYNWMPIREPESGDLLEAYRSFDFGDLLSLHILETRLLAREETRGDIGSAVLDRLGAYAGEPGFDTLLADLSAVGAAVLPAGTDPASAEALALVGGDQNLAVQLAVTALLAEAADPDRELIGAEQLQWLAGEIGASDATWQVLGQQVLMNSMELPAALLTDPTGSLAPVFADILQKQATGQPLTAQETALISETVPYNLDAWDGYQAEREKVLALLDGENAVVLAGDTHNAWNGDLTNLAGDKIGEIFATPGVSAPGLESYFAQFDPAFVEALFTGYVDGLDYAETASRGFLDMTFTPEAATGEWVFVDTVGSPSYETFVESQTYSIA